MARSTWVRELEVLLGADRVLSDPIDLQCYLCDSGLPSLLHPEPPLAVVNPRSTEEVAATVRFARDHRLPITPRGAASGQAGGCVASPGALVVDSSAMNRVLEVDPTNLQAWVQAGIGYAELNRQLEPHNLFLPPDPSSGQACTLGGMVANNSSGPRSLKYGPTSHYVLGLEVVLPSGEVIVTGGERSRALKSASGLNLTQLFLGSGGTLGFVTRVRLRLLPRPASRTAVLVAFRDMEDGWGMVQEVWKASVLPTAMEFEYPAPGTTAAAAEFRPAFHLPEAELVLIVELDGNEAGVRQDLEAVLAIARRLAQRVELADDPHGVAELWEALDSVEGAASQIRPGARRIPGGEDICVPLDRMTEALRGIRAIAQRHGIGVVSFGHAAQGNIHSGLLVKLEDPREVAGAEAAMREIHQLALELRGSLTGEHGIGTSRLEFVAQEHGAAYGVMAWIKRTLDPDNLMNPGKLWSVETLRTED
ncbi:MAG: FAD-binding oxidoreductase [Chloroflexota bacterium]